MPLQFFKFSNLPLQFSYLETYHYDCFSTPDMSFCTSLMLLGPLAGLRILIWPKMPLLPLRSQLANVWGPRHLLPSSFLLELTSPSIFLMEALHPRPPLPLGFCTVAYTTSTTTPTSALLTASPSPPTGTVPTAADALCPSHAPLWPCSPLRHA